MAFAVATDAPGQATIDMNGDGVGDTIRREVRLHRIDPVISRIVMVSGTDGVPILSVASKTPNDLFGWYVSSVGDFDGDGFEDLAVTAPASLIADGLGPNEPGGPIPPWRGRVVIISGATGGELMTIFNPEATADSIFGFGAAPISDQDNDGMPDVFVAGVRIVPAPTKENPNGTTSEWMWWVMSTVTGEPIRMGTGLVGSVGCEFLLPGETPRQFWTTNEAAGALEILPGIAGDLDGDGDVDAGDAAALMGEWSTGSPGTARISDLNGDSVVNVADLSILLSQIGFSPASHLPSDASEMVNALPLVPIAVLACAGKTVACIGDVNEQGEYCIERCIRGSADNTLPTNLTECVDCCTDTAENDLVNCSITCGFNTQDNDYNRCYSNPP